MRAYSKDKNLISIRRAHIARCAAHVFVKKNYNDTTIRDISECCNMSVGALYRYIGSKEDILHLVIEHGMQAEWQFCMRTFKRVESMSSIEAIKLAISEFYKSIDDIQDLILFSFREMVNIKPEARQGILDIDRKIANEFEKLLMGGCKKGSFKIDDIGMVAQTIIFTGQMWALRRWALKKICTLDKYIEYNTNIILKLILVSEK